MHDHAGRSSVPRRVPGSSGFADPPSFARSTGAIPFISEIESGLARIDFPEVTEEDRVTFLEASGEWLERIALRMGREDIAFVLRGYVARRRRELVGVPATRERRVV